MQSRDSKHLEGLGSPSKRKTDVSQSDGSNKMHRMARQSKDNSDGAALKNLCRLWELV